MYVIRTDSDGDVGFIYPADRCTWKDSDTVGADGVNRLITISDVTYYPGNAAGSAVSGTSPRLGYLGKYGRFIPITN